MTCSSAPCRWWNRWRSGPARRTQLRPSPSSPPRGTNPGPPSPWSPTRRPSSPRAPSLRGFWTSAVWWTRPTMPSPPFPTRGGTICNSPGSWRSRGSLCSSTWPTTSPPSTRPGSNSSRPMGGFFSFCLPSVQGSPMPWPGSSPGRWTSSPTRPSSWPPGTCPAGRESPRPMRSAPWPGSLTPWPPGRRSTSQPCRPPWRGRTGSSAALPTS